jgi:hypothetical protein
MAGRPVAAARTTRTTWKASSSAPDQIDEAPFRGARFSAANIAADALNPYTPGAPAQDFALVCYNCVEAPLPDLIFADGFEAGPTP